MNAAEEHTHEHEYIDIAESETVFVYAEVVHQVVTIQFNQRGIALSLSYADALELANGMEAVRTHIAETQKGSESPT